MDNGTNYKEDSNNISDNKEDSDNNNYEVINDLVLV